MMSCPLSTTLVITSLLDTRGISGGVFNRGVVSGNKKFDQELPFFADVMELSLLN